MDEQEVFELFLSGMLDHAVQDFQSTSQYALLKEKLQSMERDCETMLGKPERAFAEECFELLLDVYGQQECHVYRQGIQDGIRILKTLGVLA